MGEFCQVCKVWKFSGAHQCPPRWLAWSEDAGGTEDRADTVYAVDAEVAALKWAEDYDGCDSEYPIAGKDGGSVTVCVRLASGSDVAKFRVTGEFSPSYTAEEIGD